MARREYSALTDDSQKENSAARLRSPKVKPEKGRSAAKNTRAARVESDEEQEDAKQARNGALYDVGEDDESGAEQEDEEAGAIEGGSPKGRKRARANTQGDARPSGSGFGSQPKVEYKTLPRDDDGYVPGSIVRIQLRNFVTYDWVEFSPGPYLNMVLGPNGTGKSSIACAICIGLNFPPSVLGRAPDLRSFVKLGQDEGHIEIELKGPKGKPNLVVKRFLSARNKTNQFTINGVSATGKEINQRMLELNVQVTNLCSFLPQDKVAEFAAMTRPQLLRETQRAAGNASLTSWHDILIDAGKELKVMQEKLTGDKARLQNDQDRNALLERDVKKYEERQQLEREIELLELLVPLKEYTEAKDLYEEAKNAQRLAHDEVRTLEQNMQPILQLKDQYKDQQEELNSRREALKTSTRNKFGKMRKRWEESESLEQDTEGLKSRLDNLRKEERNRHRKIEQCKEKISNLQKEVEKPPKVEEAAKLSDDMRECNAAFAAVAERQRSLQDCQREVVNLEATHKAKLDDNMRRLKQLDDADLRKLNSLVQWDKDCGDTIAWLRSNRHRFRMEIFEPAMLTVTIPDQRFIAAVESCFGQNDLKTFVAQCEEDYQLLNRLVADTPEALGRKARINTWYRKQGLVSRLPVPREELRRLGFDGYAMDYIVCPEGMKWFLQSSVGLHRTAIALDLKGIDQNQAMDILSEDGGVNYIIGNVYNAVRRSRYGRRLAQNSTREIAPARNLAVATVDLNLKQQLEQAIKEAREALHVCKEQIEELSIQDRDIQEEGRVAKERKDAVVARREKVARVLKAYEQAKMNLKNTRVELQRLEDAPSVEDERAKLKDKILKLARKRADILTEYQPLIKAAIKEQLECTQIGLQVLQVSANKVHLDTLYAERHEEHQQALARFNAAHTRYAELKADVKHKLDVSKVKFDQSSEDARTRFKVVEDAGDERTLAVLQGELDAFRTQLDMNMATNAGVVEQYRQRQIEIARLSQTIEELEEKSGKVEDKIKRTRDMWEPALQQLVDSIGEKFSTAFDRINCAGEVRVAQHEDFDKWAIEIYVKFRDNEKLQLLTAERQSGGERSLTTILYLMSLTAHARAPFSLVDEINQGMDARYERTVHNSLVDVTCQTDSGQYFLITPKLLPDLLYHERMKVLCVNNGEWLPDNNSSGSLMKMIDNYVRNPRGPAA